MVDRTPQQYKIRAALSWVLALALAAYYLYLAFYTDYEINIVHYVLVGIAVIFSVSSTIMAVKANKSNK